MSQLPFDPRTAVRQALALSLDRPPFYPQNINCSAAVQQVINQLCAATAMEIQRSMTANPIRMTAYNILSNNGYNNPEFLQLLQMIAMRIDAELIRNPRNIPGRIADDVIPTAVYYYSGQLASYFPDLCQFVDHNTYNSAVQAGRQLGGFVQEAEQMIRQHMNRSMAYQQPMQQPAAAVGYANTQYGYTAPMGGRMPGDLRADDRFFTTDEATTQPKEVVNHLFGGGAQTSINHSWDQGSSYAQTQTSASSYKEEVMPEPVVPKIEKFSANPAQEYLYGFSPRTHEQEMAFDLDGNMRQYVNERTTPMDYEKHGAPYPSYLEKAAWHDNFQAVAEATDKLMSSINEDIADTIGDPDKPLFTEGDVVASDIMIADTSLLSAIAAARFTRAAVKLAKPDIQVFTQLANLKTYLHEVDLPEEIATEANSILGDLPFQSNFVQVRDLLMKLPDDFKRMYLNKLFTILKKEVNTIFRHNLNIGLKIHDFNDIDQIDVILEEDYGRLVSGAWAKHQKQHIEKMFAVPIEGKEMEIFENGDDLQKYCLDRYVTITQLSMTSTGLDVEIPEGRSVRIEQGLNPALYQLCCMYLPQASNYNEAHRHYIVTLDGLIFEVLPGWLVEKSVLIRYVGEEL